jgi:hypothetical protein
MMLIIGQVIVSSEVLTEYFRCDRSVCRGACCAAGSGIVPVRADEAQAWESERETIVAQLTPEAGEVAARVGLAERMADGGWTAPLLPDGRCLFAISGADGISCFLQTGGGGKPLSCLLYPVRLEIRPPYEFLRFDRWSACAGAAEAGRRSGTRVFEFVRSGIEACFGKEFYRELARRAG